MNMVAGTQVADAGDVLHKFDNTLTVSATGNGVLNPVLFERDGRNGPP